MGKIVCCTLEFLCKRSGVIMHLLRKEVAHKSVIDNTCSKQCLTLMIEEGFETLLGQWIQTLNICSQEI